jgi:hypothetical protein
MKIINAQINRLTNSHPYTKKPRQIEEIIRLGGELYKDILCRNSGFRPEIREAYQGFESNPNYPLEKMPNITCFSNLFFNSGGFVFASSLGHTHPEGYFEVQEIYEFHGSGGMLISTKKSLDLYVCEAGDKVAVPPNCMMTILNLSENNLTTLDMANPKQNPSSKDILTEKRGPMLAFYKDREGLYRMRWNSRYEEFEIPKDIEFNLSQNVDESLSEVLLRKRNKLANYNIQISKASPVIECFGPNNKLFTLDTPLLKLVDSIEKPLQKLLRIQVN